MDDGRSKSVRGELADGERIVRWRERKRDEGVISNGRGWKCRAECMDGKEINTIKNVNVKNV